MYPNERHFIGQTDNFSLKIASSAQIERVGTREKVETREGRQVLVRYGEVENSETVSYKDFKNPHPGGLYCTRIFGPMKNWVCTHPGCSDTKKGIGAAVVPVSRKGNDEFLGAPDGRGKYREFKCSVCGNGLYPSTLRRYRMGYIHLYQPLVHVSYIHSRQNLFAHLLRWNTKEIHSLIYNNLNLINFGHTELFSACFAPLFGFCEDSLGEALEWLRGDYFALSDQATVVLRLLQPKETQIAERLSKAKTEKPTKLPERLLSKRDMRSLRRFSANHTPQKPGRSASEDTVQEDVAPALDAMAKTLWKKKWPREPDPVVFSTAWKNSRNFPKKIESLLCPEIGTVDGLLLEDQNFFLDILSEWKKIFEVPKKRDLTILQKFHLEIFEQDPSPFDEDDILADPPPELFDILSRRFDLPSHGLFGQPKRIEKIDFFELFNSPEVDVFNLPELESFYENTFGTSESFLKDPESMYSKKFTKNSFFVVQDFLTKFQAQFFEKKFRRPFATSKLEEGTPQLPVLEPVLEPVLKWNRLNLQSGQRFLNFMCFRKETTKKSFLKPSGFCISPIWTEGTSLTREDPTRPKPRRPGTDQIALDPYRRETFDSAPVQLAAVSQRKFGSNSPNGEVMVQKSTFDLRLRCSHFKANHLNFFGSKTRFQASNRLASVTRTPSDPETDRIVAAPNRLTESAVPPSPVRDQKSGGFSKGLPAKKSGDMENPDEPLEAAVARPQKIRQQDHLEIAGLRNFEINKERSRRKFLAQFQKIRKF